MVAHTVPNPLVNKMGVGPPIAPPNWRWRTGKLIFHTYFYTPSPEEKVIRSKRQLRQVLDGMQDAPSLEQFCWRITPEMAVRRDLVYEDSQHKVYWSARKQTSRRANVEAISLTSHNQTEIQNSDSEIWSNRSSAKRQKMNSEAASPKDHSKDPKPAEKTASKLSEAGGSRKKLSSKSERKRHGSPVEFERNRVVESESKLKTKVKPLPGSRRAQEFPKSENSPSPWTHQPSHLKSTHQDFARSDQSPSPSKRQDNIDGEEYPKSLNMPEFFRFILEFPTSYEWLSDKDTLAHFLGEVEKAKNLSFPQIEDIRKRIRRRKDTISRLKMYDSTVLRAFIDLLGYKPPRDVSKDDLVQLLISLRHL